MNSLIGEFNCKLDAKGRFLMPSGLRKQFPEDQQKDFVINRGMEKCLVIHPLKVWEEQIDRIFSKNQFIEKNRRFARRFTNGATSIELDGSDRVLITKRLLEYAGLTKEVVLVAQKNKIEIWDKERFETLMSEEEEEDMAQLAEDVMGGDDEPQS